MNDPSIRFRKPLYTSIFALLIAGGWAPASAQEPPIIAPVDTGNIQADTGIAQEMAVMRKQMAAMAQRIADLESGLAQAEATHTRPLSSSLAPALPPALPSPSQPAAMSDTQWKGAPQITGAGGWSFKPRGRINIDAGFINTPDSVGAEEGFNSEARRVRLGVQGAIPGGFGYKIEADFAGDGVALTDAIVTYKTGGLVLSAGQHNTFQGLEELSSSLNTSFIERAAFTDAFGFQRRIGVSAQYHGGDVLVQAGLFSGNSADLPAKDWSVDGRIVFMPKLGDTQLHLGSSVHYRGLEKGRSVRYRQRPLVHFTDQRLINTGTIAAESERGLGLEAAVISGPFHFAAETYWQSVNRGAGLNNPTFFGGAIEAGYFLTKGDRRGYKKGTFGRVKPASPVGEGGLGAWQINARYDRLDLTDGGIVGGTQDSYQLSLIWTMTDYTRLLLNYARLNYKDAVMPSTGGNRSYGVDAVGVRAQIDF